MNKYELALVVSAKVEDEVRDAVVEKAKGYITRYNGTITEVEEWGKKKLAYEIQKMHEGFDGTTEEIIPPVPTTQADTIGAGDSHIGSVIACLKKGDSLHDAIAKANRVSSAVVATPSAILPDEEFAKLNF